ncbi:hypothetical protein GLOTRDRAFT_131285 [Gloeophyllum trabeum ATCC 11539]|uniref:Uncharacterized protein n=1 Tax=Gloeophyllum trabeum (strain ATCC 11539 / FP-39264 / Madison 617) TaxID=670483 RepID=S7PZD2_GLOTA|nr:uncharacterized protein GLOTRDRAFT_131285 [Gloeophyllum trabeum ATCC 11539]EPQ53001.1 hypothetical protein GLOTRDRAFT_131285 [Gloeophyllum trabeum ATCC 11539]
MPTINLDTVQIKPPLDNEVPAVPQMLMDAAHIVPSSLNNFNEKSSGTTVILGICFVPGRKST